MASSASYKTDEESRWVVIGICFTKVVTPTLRKVVDAELQSWYQRLCKPPDEIDKQTSGKYKKTLPPSTFSLQYENINGNNVHKSPSSYDYAVRDPLSLAKLFVQPFMAKFTGFDNTMDLSALLTIMCEADPFITSGASVYARNVRSNVRNEWAHCNFPKWTNAFFNDAIQDLQWLVKNINLTTAAEKEVCDDLEDLKNKVSNVLVDGRYSKLIKEIFSELRRCMEIWQHETDTKMTGVTAKLDNIESNIQLLRCKTENVEYSQFAEKKVPYGLRNLPAHMVERPTEVTEILELLKQGNKVGVVGRHGGDVVIRGMGGLGKTVLAQAVAWEVSKSRQVVWLDIGETPDRLKLINTLVRVLGGDVSFSDIVAAQSWLRQYTVDKDYLVVVDDVWKVDDAAVFDCLSGKCQLLITTRDATVLCGSGIAKYELVVMPQDKSRGLLYQSAGISPDEQLTPNLRRIIADLLEHCRGLPLALSLVGSNLADTRAEQDWEDVLDDLKNADLERIRSLSPKVDYPYDNLLAVIDVSYERLDESVREMFRCLAIFPEDTDIPSDVLELLWSSIQNENGKTSRKPQKHKDIPAVLERKSLILKGPGLHGKKSYRVHNLLLDFAQTKLQVMGTLNDVQDKFVKTLRGLCVDGEWNDNSTTCQKDYYFKYLPYHIYSSGRHDELLQLLFDLHWLKQKVKHVDVLSAISDFRFVDTELEEIQLLKSSLIYSAEVINEKPDSICPQLLGRLLSYEEYPRIRTLLEQLRQTCTETFHLFPEFSYLGGPEISRKTFDSGVCSLATSNTSSSTLVICGLYNGSITIFDLDTGREVQQLQGHSDVVSCLAVSQSGTILASGSRDGSTILWRMDSYEQLFVFQGKRYVNALDFSADDQRVFIGTGDGLKVYCVSTGENLSTSIPEGVKSLCTTKDGQFIATVGYTDETIKLWKADTLNFETSLVGHTDWVRSVVATDSGKNNPMLVSASRDGRIKIWDLKTYQEIRTLYVPQSDVSSVAVSDDKKYIISGHDDGSMRLWCLHTGRSLSCYEGHTNVISGVAIISNAKKAVTVSLDGSVRVWQLGTAAYMEQNSSSDHSEDVTYITMARCGSVCISASTDGTFKVSNPQAEKTSFSVRGDLKWGKHVAVSADHRHVLSLSMDYNSTKSSIKVWNLSDGSVINEIDSDGTPEIVRFSSDGLQVIIGCEDNHVFIWNWQKRHASLKEVILPASYTVEIACDRKMIYTCSQDMHTCEINLESLQVSTVRQGPSVPVISPDGESALFGSIDKNVFFHWKLSTDSLVDHSAGHPDDSIVTAIDITSNGKFALSGSSSGTFSLVDIECSKIVLTFAKTESGVAIRFVCILSDDVRFVFVDEANRIELRTLNDIEASMKLSQPDVKVTCITAVGSNYALLGCDDGQLLLFHLSNDSQLKFPAHKDAISEVRGELGGHDRSRRFASGSISGSVKLWNVEENLPTLIWSHDSICSDSITALEFVPCSDDIIIASGKKIDRINATGVVHSYEYYFMGKIETMRVVHNSLSCVHKNKDSNRAEQMMTKWNLNETMEESSISCRPQKVLRVNNSGDLVAKLGHESLVIEDFKTGTVLCRFPIPNAKDIIALALVPGAEFLLSCSERDKTLKLWNLAKRECVEKFHFDQDVLAIACGENGVVCVGLKRGRVCFLRFNKFASQSGKSGEEKGKEDPGKREVPGKIERCAMASPNLEEKANSARLSRLLVDKGTEAFTNTFNAIHPPVSLLSAQHLQGDRHVASRAELEHKSKKPKEDSPGSWEWRRTSQKHRDKFEKLHEFGKKSPEKITEINDVRVCFKNEFLIQRGSDGTCVYVGISKDGGERAVKRLVRSISGSLAEQEKEILNERNAIKSNHVVKYRFLDKSNDDWLYLIMDLCEETLEDFVQHISRDELLKIGQHIIKQILRGLADIHHDPRSILHRDLKPSNILRDVDGNWLLADFGISRILTPGEITCRTKQKGTDHWRAVESCLNYASGTVEDKVRYKKESDVQVAGMLAFYVLTNGKHPFGEEPDQLRNVLDGKPVYLNMVKDPPANDLITWMLSHEPKDRPLAEEALKHPYLASPEQQFKMLCEVANQREIKKGDVDSDVVQKLNTISGDWQNQIDPKVLNYLRINFETGRLRNYGPSWCECLRLIRNMNQHWYDTPRPRPHPEAFYLVDNPQKYFLNVFPNLPTDVHRIVRSCDWKERPNIEEYFK